MSCWDSSKQEKTKDESSESSDGSDKEGLEEGTKHEMKKRIVPNNATPGTMKTPAPNGKKPTDIRLHTRLSKQHYKAKSKGKRKVAKARGRD
ncbi:hypothetical protein FRX31_008902 [Thalictrum thalictroides]|uniref:Uncharacterized protein n=1 Tax=Thalictrum thalictroides TaxID=46969 RepID=A0A7J6WZG9_THATH|nr:hypothetical protein FRX31_008902 [Thalictrum thalictroides]